MYIDYTVCCEGNAGLFERFHIIRLACILLVYLGLAPTYASAGPWIEVSNTFVYNDYLVPPGGSFVEIIVVTNVGDAPLTVAQIGFVEQSAGPRGWLSVSETDLYVLPGEENSVDFDIVVDGSAYDLTADLLGEVFLRSDAENSDSLAIDVWITLWDEDPVVFWDLLRTDERMYSPYFDPDGECLGLAVSSHGEFGVPGWRGMHLDYWESGLECGTRDEDYVYLLSGSPFVLINDGGSVSLTTSIYQSGQVKDYYWQPAPGSPGLMGGFRSGYGSYQYSHSGELINRDGRIAMERSYYAPRTPPGHSNYIIARTRFYSGDGQAHSHVTVGSATDWDIPSDQAVINTSGVSSWWTYWSNQFVYVQGTDTIGSQSCQLHANRYGTDALIYGRRHWYDGHWRYDQIDSDVYGAWAGPQALLRDTSLARNGSPLDPPQPDGQAWWDDISAHQGYVGDPTEGNQAVWYTYLHDFDLGAQDTLTFWSVLTTVRDGSLADLRSHVSTAFHFVEMTSIIFPCGFCCSNRVGNANGTTGPNADEPTIGDVSAIIDALFISGEFSYIPCLEEADVNQNGACNAGREHITIGDISVLIDYLFITGPSLGLPACTW